MPAAVEQGTFVWNHLVTPDQKASGTFFSKLLGWTLKELDAGPLGVYSLFQKHGRDVAGMMNPTVDYTRKLGARWYAYIAVDDVDECARRVPQLGGEVIVPPHDVPGVGRACLVADPMGAAITLVSGWSG